MILNYRFTSKKRRKNIWLAIFCLINVFGPLYAMQAAIPRMLEHSGGLIMNVSSEASRAAIPGLVAYGASKAALDLVMNTARKELATENIRMITVYPPNTATNAAKHMLGDPEFLRRSLDKALTSTGMVVVPAEFVAEKIVEAARDEPNDLVLDEGLLEEAVSLTFGVKYRASVTKRAAQQRLKEPCPDAD